MKTIINDQSDKIKYMAPLFSVVHLPAPEITPVSENTGGHHASASKESIPFITEAEVKEEEASNKIFFALNLGNQFKTEHPSEQVIFDMAPVGKMLNAYDIKVRPRIGIVQFDKKTLRRSFYVPQLYEPVV